MGVLTSSAMRFGSVCSFNGSIRFYESHHYESQVLVSTVLVYSIGTVLVSHKIRT